MHHKNPGLHRHELIQLRIEPLVRSVRRHEAAVRDPNIHRVELIDEEWDDAGSVVRILVDRDGLPPSVEANEGGNCGYLGRVVEGGTDEERGAGGGEWGAGGREGDDGDLGAVAEVGDEFGLGGGYRADDRLGLDIFQ